MSTQPFRGAGFRTALLLKVDYGALRLAAQRSVRFIDNLELRIRRIFHQFRLWSRSAECPISRSFKFFARGLTITPDKTH